MIQCATYKDICDSFNFLNKPLQLHKGEQKRQECPNSGLTQGLTVLQYHQ